MWYIMGQMRKVKPDIIYAKRKARQAKLERADFGPYGVPNDSSNSVVFNAQASEANIPLHPVATEPYQRWDKTGHAVGYAGDPRLYAPEPQHPQLRTLSIGGGGYNEDGGVGTTYPKNADAEGRTPLRQESGDSVEWNQHGRRDTFDIPRIGSPVHEPPNNPFENTPTDTNQPMFPPPLAPSAPSVTQSPSQTQYSNYYPQPTVNTNLTPAASNSYTNATPIQFNHPQVPFRGHAADATDVSLQTVDGHTRGTDTTLQGPAGRAFSPPPSSYITNAPGR